ncbi:MAG: hypothetical protein U5J83_12095 [Bryobacterales bacterium]|nr:hypothetical protein [Bryobacterales bacterium]
MTHDGASAREERLSRYLDGQLAPAEAAAFEDELKRDEGLREELRQWQTMRNRLRAAVDAQPVPDRLQAAIAARTAGRRRVFPLFSQGPLRAALALTLCAVIAVGAWVMLRPRNYTLADFPPAVASMIEIGIGKHVSCVKERVGASFLPLGTYQGEVPPEYSKMLDAAKRALPSDFKLVELHLCGSEGREFAHLTLQKGDRYLSVLLTERRESDPSPAGASVASAAVGDVDLYAVSADGLDVGVFALPRQFAYVVSDFGPAENLAFTKEVAEAIR